MEVYNTVSIATLCQGVRLRELNVRVIYKWERSEFKDKSNTESVEMLLIDAKNDCVQATIKKPLIKRFKDKFVVGEVYNIKSLTVSKNGGYDKATSHACRLNVEFSSRITHLPNDKSIPSNCYRFVSFDDIVNGKVPTTNYIDVVGKLYEIGPLIETKNGFKCRSIKLEDIRGVVLQCTLWSPHATELPELLKSLPNPEHSKIIVCRCVEAKTYESSWRVQTTFNATRFEINPNIPEVDAFQESLSSQAPSNSLQYVEEGTEHESFELSVDEVLSISEIIKNEKSGYFYTVATVVDLEATAGWYYHSCKSCRSKAARNEHGRWICSRPGCAGNTSGFPGQVPRYQLKFVVKDFSDIECNFVAFDSQIQQYVGESAQSMLSRMEKDGDGDSFPGELATFIDNRYLFKIFIHDKFNVEHSSKSYTVQWMSDDVDKIHHFAMKYEEALKLQLEEYSITTTNLRRMSVNRKNGSSSSSGAKNTEHLTFVGECSSGGATSKEPTTTTNDIEVIDCEGSSTSSRITPLKRTTTDILMEFTTRNDAQLDVGSATKYTSVFDENNTD